MTARVAVVGGGLAGITAALRCADAGYAVRLFESRPWLGGLTHSFPRGELWIDNGQHVFLRCCDRYLALLDRLGMRDAVRLQPRLDIPVSGAGRVGRLRRLPLPAPLHLSWALLRYPWLSPGARLRFVRAALALRAVDTTDPRTDATSFGGWLRAHGQDRDAVDSLWDLVGIATLNARADDVSLALAATVFQVGLLTDSDAADIGWSRIPLRRLHGDAGQAALTAAGATVIHEKVTAVRRAEAGWSVRTGESDYAADAVVSAVPPTAAQALLPADAVDLPANWAAALGSSPIVNIHVVYDRPVMDEPLRAGVGSPVQWVFDRTDASGLRAAAGRRSADVADGPHDGSTPVETAAAAPSTSVTPARFPTGAQYLAVSVSAADAFVDRPVAELRREFLPALERLLPAARTAQVADFFVTRERHATFRPAPGSARLRPPAATALPGLSLAGAWTDTGWPATMEGAVRSGEAAAAEVISHLAGLLPRAGAAERTGTPEPRTRISEVIR
ncbi:squalene-associated FAD-dependent desaturase [Nocardia kruczakiae]|uniref:Squalene-associated FAD-dependent desaturase n=1 Tax=Nocardia kruczakiae TaxID=261477 RepID=A0ABU1XE16_9NOCA|nr:hydroxysqualene dehydroxylase HpnE [Nocardia kruczakiae]MDR7168793.1 squalene-associated FAD-dependent desaturase [Nocardia kruczakiae]